MTDLEKDKILLLAHSIGKMARELQSIKGLLKEIADASQTDYPCNTCANKGDHDGECKNCVADSATIRWETPSHYKPKQTDCPWK